MSVLDDIKVGDEIILIRRLTVTYKGDAYLGGACEGGGGQYYYDLDNDDTTIEVVRSLERFATNHIVEHKDSGVVYTVLDEGLWCHDTRERIPLSESWKIEYLNSNYYRRLA